MSLLKFLAFAEAISEETTELVSIIAIAAIAALAIIMLVICLTYKKMDTKAIVYAAISIASAFVLSFIKVSPVTNGGSITLASFVPILIYAYVYGPVRGLVAGLIFGVLQFIQSPYMLTPLTFVLDYLLAFAPIFLMGLARLVFKKENTSIFAGTAATYVIRFIVHFFSGLIYFQMGIIAEVFPADSFAFYSLVYNLVYLVPDMIITMVVLAVLVATKNFPRLVRLMRPDFYAKNQEAPAEVATDAQ